MTGISLDLPFFQETSKRLEKRMAEIEKQVYEAVGKPFNINSTQQLSDVLFKRLGLEPPDRGNKTASGHFSTSAGVLDLLRGKHPVVDMILEHRELSKIKSTYVDALQAALNPDTGCVHTSYSQIGAVTGRLSSSNPNLQNIPIRTEEGRRIRNGFVAGKDNVLALGGLFPDRVAHRRPHGPGRRHAGGIPRRGGYPYHDRSGHLTALALMR